MAGGARARTVLKTFLSDYLTEPEMRCCRSRPSCDRPERFLRVPVRGVVRRRHQESQGNPAESASLGERDKRAAVEEGEEQFQPSPQGVAATPRSLRRRAGPTFLAMPGARHQTGAGTARKSELKGNNPCSVTFPLGPSGNRKTPGPMPSARWVGHRSGGRGTGRRAPCATYP